MGLGRFKRGAIEQKKSKNFLARSTSEQKIAREKRINKADAKILGEPKVKQVYHQETNSFKEKPIDKKEEKQLEILKAEPKKSDITFETLHADLLKQSQKIDELIGVQNIEPVLEDEHEFVESIETVDTGGNVINEIIRLRHTDIVIVVTNDSIILFESLEDYDKKKEHLGLFVFGESEKIPLGEEEIKEEKL